MTSWSARGRHRRALRGPPGVPVPSSGARRWQPRATRSPSRTCFGEWKSILLGAAVRLVPWLVLEEPSMPYATGRTFHDADSHLMELGDWLAPYADPDVRSRLRPLYLGGAGKLADEAV